MNYLKLPQTILKLKLVLILIFVGFFTNAQNVSTTYNSFAQPAGSFTVCGPALTNSIKIHNGNGATLTGTVFTLHIPTGGSYVPGTIVGATEVNITDLSNPIFSLADLPGGNDANISYNIQFNCSVIAFQNAGGITSETMDFTYNGSTTQNAVSPSATYNVVAATLNIINNTMPTYTGLVGDNFTQTITIRNGGLGATSTAFIALDKASGTNSFSSPSIGTLINDTIWFAPSDFGADNLLTTNEDITVSFTVHINNCTNLNRAIVAGWGCGGTACQTSAVSNSNITITNTTPNLTATVPNPNYDYCMSGELVKQTVRIVNTGAGPASNIVLSTQDYQSGNFGGQNYFDTTATWQVKDKNGNVIGTLHNFTGAQVAYANASCTLVSGYTDLQVALKDILLLPNDTIYVDVWSRMSNVGCSDYNCQTHLAWFGLQTKLDYKDQCGNGSNTEAFKLQVARLWTYFLGSLTSPTDVIGGTNFNLDIDYNYFYTSGNSPSGNGSTYIAMPLTGTDMVPTASTVNIQSLTLPVFVRNDSMIIGPIPQNTSISNNHLVIPMKANCGTGGIKTINISTVNKYDACAPASTFGCFNASINIHCPYPCPIGGATPINFTLKRINYGLVDNNNDGIPDASGTIDLTKISLDHSVNGDTLQGTWNIKVYANTTTGDPNINQPFTHTYIDFQLDPLGSGLNNSGTLNPVPAAVVAIYPAGGGAVINCTVTPTIVGTIAHYDFTTCKALWNFGDSMVVKANFTVNETNSNRYNGTTYGAFDLFVTQNQVYSTYAAQATPTTAPINNTTYTCDYFNDYNQMSRIWLSPYEPVNQIINGCTNNLISSMRQYTRGQEAPNIFPYEVRNFWIIDTMKVVIPHGFVFRNNSATFRRDQFLPNTTVNIANANVLQIADTLYFINLKTLYKPFGGTLDVSDEAEAIYIYFSIDPTCNAVTGSAYGGTQSYGLGNGLNTPSLGFGDNSVVTGGFNGSANMYVYNAPQPVLAGGGNVSTNTGTASWSIQMQNLSNSVVAANSYLYISPVNSFTNIVITNTATSAVVTPDANGFYQLGDLAASGNMNFTVTADLNACSKDSFRINSGWGCSGYPSTFVAQSCTQSSWLIASGYKAGIDVTFTMPTSVTLCMPFTVQTTVNSTSIGSLGHEVYKVFLPKNVHYVANSVQTIYPVGASLTSVPSYNPTVIPAASGDTLVFNVNDLTGGVGLTGVGDLLHKSITIAFDVQTFCGFNSGASMKALFTGSSVCGDLVPRIRKSSAPIKIIGAAPTTQYAITAVTPVNIRSCDAGQDIIITVTNTSSNNSTVNDSLFVDLSPNFQMVAGSLIGIHNGPIVSTETQLGNVVHWSMPAGIAAGDSMKFSIKLATIAATCGSDATLDIYTAQGIALACGGSACNTPVITGELVTNPINAVCCPAQIGNFVWNDVNQNGVQDANEVGVAGLTVTLFNATNQVLSSTITDGYGNYNFPGLAPGSYRVGVTLPTSYLFTTAKVGTDDSLNSDVNVISGLTPLYTLMAGDSNMSVDAGIYLPNNANILASVGDKVWYDINGNGLQDVNELGVAGIAVTLYQADGTTVVASTITNSLGNYIFNSLPASNYIVGFGNIPALYTLSPQNADGLDVNGALNSDVSSTLKTPIITLAAGQSNLNIDLGIVPPPNTASLGNKVWNDLNKDGLQTANEPGMPGITVSLLDSLGLVLATTTTNANGEYEFVGLIPAKYTVSFTNIPKGYNFTTKDADATGINGSVNSDVSGLGVTDVITLAAGDINMNLDAGLVTNTVASVGNKVWYDDNADGLQDPNEKGVAGVLVTLYNNGVAVASTITGVDGSYLFSNVEPATYSVTFSTIPANTEFTTQESNPASAVGSNANSAGVTPTFTIAAGLYDSTIDAGLRYTGGLGDFVWNDLNQNGIQDAGEPGLANITVTLYAADGITVLKTTTTDANGKYLFSNLASGNYIVGFSNLPFGFNPTIQNGPVSAANNSDLGANNKTGIATVINGKINVDVDAGLYNPNPLPLIWANFNVSTNKCVANITWATGGEKNLTTFDVLRKNPNSTDFVKIATIKAIGNSNNVNNYTYLDNAITDGMYAYEIKVNDVDGNSSLSTIIFANALCNNTSNFNISPNPTHNILNVQINSSINEIYVVKLYDLTGNIIFSTDAEVNNTSKIVVIPMNSLATGIYMLKVTSSQSSKTFEVSKN